MPTLPTALRNGMCDLAADSWDAGSGPATIEVRTGATPGAGTLLLTFTMNDAAWGNSGASVAGRADVNLGSAISATAVATGTAGNARVKDSDGTTRMDLTVGTSGADLNLSTTSIVSGIVYQLTAGTMTQPAS